MTQGVLYTNQNLIGEIRVPLAFQVAAARDFCMRFGLSVPVAQDEIVGSSIPFVFNTIISDEHRDVIYLPADWFLQEMIKTYHLHIVDNPMKCVTYYLQNGKKSTLGAEMARARKPSLTQLIAYY